MLNFLTRPAEIYHVLTKNNSQYHKTKGKRTSLVKILVSPALG